MIEVSELDGGVTKVTLSGRIDFAGAQAIDAPMKAVAAASKSVVIDLSGVEFIASMGLRILIMCAKTIHSGSGRVVLLGAKKGVADVIHMSGIDELIPVFDTEADAISAAVPA